VEIDVWRQKEIKKENEEGACPTCSKARVAHIAIIRYLDLEGWDFG
jgi:hypothetical protein